VVGNAAGGGTDTVVRLVQNKLQERLGRPVVIDNRPGGNNLIAVQAVTKAPPDGYTLLAGTMGMLTINPALFANLPYDTMRDLIPISIICSYPVVIAVNAAAPVKNLQELIAYIKANPEKANAGGTGSVYQIATKLFEMRTGTKLQFITYRSHTESLTGLMRGDTLMAVVDTAPVAGPLKDGRVRALAVLSPQRLPNYPDVPTIAEAGLKDFELELWAGLLAPAGTPEAIVRKLNEAVVDAVKSEDVRKAMINLEVVPIGGTSADYAARLRREIAMWADVVKTGNIEIQR
jgi:tripartite-type tricarboxylate transporter receptor subunit TctC